MITIFFVHDLKGTFFAFMNADMKNQNIIQQKKVKQQPKKTPTLEKNICPQLHSILYNYDTLLYFFHITKKFLEKSNKYTPQFLLLLSK